MISTMITTNRPAGAVLIDVFKAIILQGGRCTTEHGNCSYGSAPGTPESHCAVGWLLPSDNELLMGDGGGIGGLIAKVDNTGETYTKYTTLGPNEAFIREHEGLLSVVQAIHDSVESSYPGVDGKLRSKNKVLEACEEQSREVLGKLIDVWNSRVSVEDLSNEDRTLVTGEPVLLLEAPVKVIKDISNLSFAGFTAFVNQMDPDQVIDHHMFTTCSIGDYFKYELGGFPGGKYEVMPESFIPRGTKLNMIIRHTARAERLIPTYGALAEVLKVEDILSDAPELHWETQETVIDSWVAPEPKEVPTLEGMINWLIEQPTTTELRHYGWEDCAIGLYVESLDTDETPYSFSNLLIGSDDPFTKQVGRFLGNPSKPSDRENDMHRYGKTTGGLFTLLIRNYPELVTLLTPVTPK